MSFRVLAGSVAGAVTLFIAGYLIFGILALSIDLGELGYVNLYKGYALVPVDVLAETMRTALAGGVIGAVLGMMNKEGDVR